MKIETVDDVILATGIKILVYGPAGSGKTVLCSTCPGNKIILSAEAGLLSLKGLPQDKKSSMGILQINSVADVGTAYSMLAEKKLADWLCIDSTSEISETLLSTLKKGNPDPRKAYMEMADQMLDMTRMFRDIPEYNILVTCKQTRVTDDGTGITTYGPWMPGRQVDQQLPYMFDEVFALRVEPDGQGEGKFVRILQTDQDTSYIAKDRSGKLDMFEVADIEHIANKINS